MKKILILIYVICINFLLNSQRNCQTSEKHIIKYDKMSVKIIDVSSKPESGFFKFENDTTKLIKFIYKKNRKTKKFVKYYETEWTLANKQIKEGFISFDATQIKTNKLYYIVYDEKHRQMRMGIINTPFRIDYTIIKFF